MKLGDRVTIKDRGMKSHGLSGFISSIDSSIEGSTIYGVLVEQLNKAGKKSGIRNINYLKDQIELESK